MILNYLEASRVNYFGHDWPFFRIYPTPPQEQKIGSEGGLKVADEVINLKCAYCPARQRCSPTSLEYGGIVGKKAGAREKAFGFLTTFLCPIVAGPIEIGDITVAPLPKSL